MITVGYSTRSHNPQFIDRVKKSIGLKDFQIIEKINNGETSLTTIYNQILDESINDIIVLCHDDIIFDTEKWGKKILNHFSDSAYGVLGVAGTTSIPESGRWWEDTSKMVGIVNHKNNGKKWESKYCRNWHDEIIEAVMVDGLFIALDKSKIKSKFDENIPNFHFYDIDFTFSNHLLDVKVGVIFDVRLTHLSIGQTNDKWEENRRLFVKKHEKNIPYHFVPKVKLPKIPFFSEKFRVNVIIQSSGDINSLELLCNNIKNYLKENYVINVIINDDKIDTLKNFESENVVIHSGYFDSLSQNLSIMKWDLDFISDKDLVFILDQNIELLNDIFSSFSKIYSKDKKNFGCGLPITLNNDDTILSTKLVIQQLDQKILINSVGFGSYYNVGSGQFKHQLGLISPVLVTTKSTLVQNDWLRLNFSSFLINNEFAAKCYIYNKNCIIDTNSVVKLKSQKTLQDFSSDYQELYKNIIENKKTQSLIIK